METFLSSSEAAQALGVSRSTLLRWFREGRISSASRDHRGWRRFLATDIDRIRRELGETVAATESPEEKRRRERLRTYLRRVPSFRRLPEAVLDDLARCARFQGLLAGQRLFSAGDRANGLHILVKGKVRIFRTSPEGREQTLAVEEPFHTLDEAVLFQRDERHGSFASCLQSSTVLILPLVRVRQLTLQHSHLAQAFLREFTRRIESLEVRIEELGLLSLEQRLARNLLEWSRQQDHEHTVRLPFTHAEWASLLGAARESLSRALIRLERDGLLERHGRSIKICQREALENL